MKYKIAIVLSGSGVYDGAEIHEATMTMLAVSKAGLEYQCFAPDIDQMHVVNHFTGEEMKESRNVLVESARIARGNVKSLDQLEMKQFHALIFPGGFGVAKNLCSYATDGVEFTVDSEVERVVRDAHSLKKPIGALCISPVLIAKILSDVNVTVGEDPETVKVIGQIGARHTNATHGEVIVDNLNKVYSTPCYMLDANISQIYDGATALVQRIINDL